MNFHQYYMGEEFDAHKYFGAHYTEGEGTTFRTFAPAANKITITGDFNDWNEQEMSRLNDRAFFELTIPEAKPGDAYMYRIYHHNGYTDHNDPYGRFQQLRPDHASIITDENSSEFHDEAWMENRDKNILTSPMNIYEIHAGSWKQHEDGSWLNYRELADMLIPYLKENGFNYTEVMPLGEFPFDGSWGYQSTGYFAPTSRYGTPEDLKYFVDRCHENEIGVILDFVPVHFAIDAFALANYDGTPLYEYPNQAVGKNEWGSCNFMHSRGEVRSFLNSSANYWLDEFHFDGLRLDAVSNLIYWQGDARRGVNGMTIGFLQKFCQGLKERHPGVILIAEDSSAYKGVTKPADQGGLGFDLKWDLGWMNDTLSFFQTDFPYRKDNYHKLTFGMVYFYDENFILPLSHDEVVHGKGTIVNKMAGTKEQKLDQARALYLYMFAHPGKKLNFMGNELAQFREWDEKRPQDWELLSDDKHAAFHRFFMDLGKTYEWYSALWEKDYDKDGFAWVQADDPEHQVYAFVRKGTIDPKEPEKTGDLLAVFNFSNQDIEDYAFDFTKIESTVKNPNILLNSAWKQYGGSREPHEDYEKLSCKDSELHICLPALSGKLLEIVLEPAKPAEENNEKAGGTEEPKPEAAETA